MSLINKKLKSNKLVVKIYLHKRLGLINGGIVICVYIHRLISIDYLYTVI